MFITFGHSYVLILVRFNVYFVRDKPKCYSYTAKHMESFYKMKA